ncbi:MAG: hypothetical protein HYY81_03560 [Deltaproteobacteria bacterium]|nr:hypothetical protein [Deltaproteobacteria bacterium]
MESLRDSITFWSRHGTTGKRGRESFIHRALVEANRKLIEIFEAKIKTKLDEIWGASDDAK